MQPLLEASGLKAGADFFLAFSPERVDPGNPTFQTHNIPKVVGGINAGVHRAGECALRRGRSTTVVPVSSPRVAEMVKLLENTFRAVNIGLVNELALMCDRMGIDVWEVIDAAKTKPFGFMPFYPGPRPGRPLHPDRSVLPLLEGQAERLRRALHRAGRARQRRDAALRGRQDRRRAQPKRKAVNGSKILVLGLAYKRDIDDMRESPALDVMGLLHERGAWCRTTIRTCRKCTGANGRGGSTSWRWNAGRGSSGQYDCVVVITDHKAFDYEAMVAESDLVVDTRNAIKRPARNVFKLGAPSPEGEAVAHV